MPHYIEKNKKYFLNMPHHEIFKTRYIHGKKLPRVEISGADAQTLLLRHTKKYVIAYHSDLRSPLLNNNKKS